jgi:NTE family protein
LFLEEFRAPKYVAIGAQFVWNIKKQFDFRLEGYVFHPLNKLKRNEDLTAGFDPIKLSPRFMGTGGFVYTTPIGPISISANYYDHETKPWSFLFHIGYIIFNKRALY